MKETSEIPKIIHYCWFGGKEKPKIVKKCIESWKRNLPDYKILEWNESNFDINMNQYVKEAYESGKYAFVSDFVRVFALYNYGGIYLDTDVEVYKSFDDLLHHPSFWGFEQENYIATSTIGAVKGNDLIKLFLDSYVGKKFNGIEGNELTNVAIITNILGNIGLELNGKYQVIKDMGVFYPQTYFSPFDYINYRSSVSEKTYTMHLFYKSWLPPKVKFKSFVKIIVSKIIGGEGIYKLRILLTEVRRK